MNWKKEYLDVILVPSGLCLVFGYHIFLIFRCIRCPQTTVIGYENHFRLAWVVRMLQTDAKNRGIPLQVISSTITAATSLASISLALSSLIGTLVGSSLTHILQSPFIYGDTRPTIISIKHISLLICFLVAFASFIQCVRCLVHSNFLISMPNNDIPVTYVQRELIRGGLFWCIGLRAIYFATNLLLWIFGPIPMFVSSVVMVVVLYFLDTNSTPLHQFQSAHLL
ncbi:uncharacterized protein LOC116198403 [Punica granatum]|uniref:Uncharacterized protein n=2 Tax=Punica granatum TaxID=22663 RepID=A0A218X8Y8_PUNGR|nr:uncharacterized protein LOC116198403 [Punica granatum]OWM81427.1 hypothetical protein CDL15_Pgr007465 [Punica granatum]PKI56262.1 hypothetical protein CRG98_023281 [Punica granatum]